MRVFLIYFFKSPGYKKSRSSTIPPYMTRFTELDARFHDQPRRNIFDQKLKFGPQP